MRISDWSSDVCSSDLGTLLVEWLNVSLGFDVSFLDGPGLYDGFVYVGVTSQYGGVFGEGEKPQGLKDWDADRYGMLVHPGDDWSYDIFTQAGWALRSEEHTSELPSLMRISYAVFCLKKTHHTTPSTQDLTHQDI